MVTHDNILANCEAVVDHLPIGVSWLPQYHDMGLIGYYIFFALKGGTTYGFSPVDFIQRPALWLETISRYRGTASSAPNFAYEYCLRPDKVPAADARAARPELAAVPDDRRRAGACRRLPRLHSEVRAVRPQPEELLLRLRPGRVHAGRVELRPDASETFDRAALREHSVRAGERPMPTPTRRRSSAAAGRWARPRSGSST